METRHEVEARRGMTLPGRALRRLAQVGIFARPAVSLEHQHLARRYVVRGVESGGAVAEIGRYVTFCTETGEPLAYLHPLDALGVNGVHAVVVAPVLVRVEMFRSGRTYDLLITRHTPGAVADDRRPKLQSAVLFRGLAGYVDLDLLGKDKALAGSVVPAFYSRGGEPLGIPAAFESVVMAITVAVNCRACKHSHYLVAPSTANRATA